MSDHLTVGVNRADDRVEIHLAGEVDVAELAALRDSIEPYLAPEQTIVMDLSQVTFADSSLLKVLEQARGKLTECGGSLLLRNPSEQARRLLTFAEMEDLVQDEVDRQNDLQ